MTWFTIIVAGIITYFTRMTMVALVDRDLLGERVKAVLAYVPSAVLPGVVITTLPVLLISITLDIVSCACAECAVFDASE